MIYYSCAVRTHYVLIHFVREIILEIKPTLIFIEHDMNFGKHIVTKRLKLTNKSKKGSGYGYSKS